MRDFLQLTENNEMFWKPWDDGQFFHRNIPIFNHILWFAVAMSRDGAKSWCIIYFATQVIGCSFQYVQELLQLWDMQPESELTRLILDSNFFRPSWHQALVRQKL